MTGDIYYSQDKKGETRDILKCLGGLGLVFVLSFFLIPLYMEHVAQPTLMEGMEKSTTCLSFYRIVVVGGGMIYPLTTDNGREDLQKIYEEKKGICSRMETIEKYFDTAKKEWDYSKIPCDDLSWMIVNSDGSERVKFEDQYFTKGC